MDGRTEPCSGNYLALPDFSMRSLLRIVSATCVAACLVAGAPGFAQPRKRLLVIGEEKGYRHEAVTHAMVTIERLGKETGLWDTVIRTDTEAASSPFRHGCRPSNESGGCPYR